MHWEVCSERLIDLKRPYKLGNLKGATKTTLLKNGYSYPSHFNELLKLKESKVRKRISDLTIAEECCSPPKRNITRTVIPLYDRNKCPAC